MIDEQPIDLTNTSAQPTAARRAADALDAIANLGEPVAEAVKIAAQFASRCTCDAAHAIGQCLDGL